MLKQLGKENVGAIDRELGFELFRMESEKAKTLSQKASEKERLYIEAMFTNAFDSSSLSLSFGQAL